MERSCTIGCILAALCILFLLGTAASAAGTTGPGGQGGNGIQNYTISQTISDQAQEDTIAFDGLAFMTGECLQRHIHSARKSGRLCGIPVPAGQ